MSLLFPTCFTFAQRHAVKFVKKFFKEKDIEAVLERLDRLTQDEARTAAAQTLAVVHGLVQNMRGFMDGEQLTRLVVRCIEYPLLSRRESIHKWDSGRPQYVLLATTNQFRVSLSARNLTSNGE